MKLTEVRRIAMSLPEVSEEPHFHYSSFRVRGKIFATFPPEGGHLHVFVPDDERELALALEPGFLETLHWGQRVAGLRVLLPKAKPKMVARLLSKAWSQKAPKKLADSAKAAEMEPGAEPKKRGMSRSKPPSKRG